VNLREMKVRQKQEQRQIEEYDRQSQARRDTLAASFEREKQVLLNLCIVLLENIVITIFI